MSFEVSGKLHVKYDTVQVKETFKKREFVLEIANGMYPQHVKFQLLQDKTAALDSYNVGDELQVSFDLQGREWQGKYFTNLNAWRIQQGTAPNSSPPPQPQTEKTTDFPSASDEPQGSNEQLDDLPF